MRSLKIESQLRIIPR